MPTELTPHDLTSDSSHAPFVVSASSIVNGDWAEWHAFDGVAGTGAQSGWGSGSPGPDWLQIDLGTGPLIGSYALGIPGNQGGGIAPKNFTLDGSNDGASWQVLDTRTGESGWNPGDTRTYVCASPGTFRYLRLNVTANNGGSYIMIAEMYVYEGTVAGTTPQAITFAPIPDHAGYDDPFPVTASSDSGLTVSLSVASGPASIAAGVITLNGSGDVTVRAVQAGDGTYAVATPVDRTFTVAPLVNIAPVDLTSNTSNPPVVVSGLNEYHQAAGAFQGPTGSGWLSTVLPAYLQIDLGDGTAVVLGGYSVTAWETSDLTRTPRDWTMLGSNDGSAWDVADTRVGEAGWTTQETRNYACAVATTACRYFRFNVTAEQGTETIAEIRQLALYAASGSTALLSQMITFPPLSDGAANDPPFVLIGTSDSGLPLKYLVTAGLATISGNTVTITGVGSVTIEARQPGNGTYAPATPVDRSFTVAPAQRGCIAYDQIKASDRTGNGNQLLAYSPAPASATSPGTPGQVAFDAAGYWYFCYAVDQWGRIGPTGYGSAAASPPSW
jgi:F5/8 type C domain